MQEKGNSRRKKEYQGDLSSKSLKISIQENIYSIEKRSKAVVMSFSQFFKHET